MTEAGAQDVLRQMAAPVAFVYLLWISIFMSAQMLLSNTVEEKSNRLVEVLLSSLTPTQLMAGKILGIAATGLTVVGSWVAVLVLAATFLVPSLGLPAGVDLGALARDPWLLGSFVVYFLLGYLFYASILVAIGSVCNTLKEAQNLMGPITLLLIVPLFAMLPVSRDPNGTLAQVLSHIPFFTPFAMMNRIGGPPPAIEYVTSTLVLVGSIAAMLWAAGKVFRVGILMTGKPPRPAEVWRWIRS